MAACPSGQRRRRPIVSLTDIAHSVSEKLKENESMNSDDLSKEYSIPPKRKTRKLGKVGATTDPNPTTTSNKYDSLSDTDMLSDSDSDTDTNKLTKTSPPPPIIFPGRLNRTEILQYTKPSSDFHIKYTRNNTNVYLLKKTGPGLPSEQSK